MPSVGSHRALQPGRGGSPPLFTCTEGLTQRSQGAAGEGCSEGEVQAARRQTWRRGATQVARHCPRPPDAAQGPRQARRTRNPLLRALMAIRWPEWKITRSPGPSLELAAARLLRTACGEEESASAPPPPPASPRGPGAVSQSLGACRHPRGGTRAGAGGVASQGALEKALLPWAGFLTAQGARGSAEHCSPGEPTVPRASVWVPLGRLGGSPKQSCPCTCWRGGGCLQASDPAGVGREGAGAPGP